ncbi:hypothetical protein J7T55_008073 [Diaporthe amygdali]|uniref:uncharacterized protein n=1 Tax=Phomopsis amygdali TaxID=1214568 RepID=UPI0022FF210E|nr:uncharacterized protein J7T55_008073 [Diaporthe amygdali]KAJ0114235.1 hypothetical protein J7T55_008073 [Diaporthe amygdali]
MASSTHDVFDIRIAMLAGRVGAVAIGHGIPLIVNNTFGMVGRSLNPSRLLLTLWVIQRPSGFVTMASAWTVRPFMGATLTEVAAAPYSGQIGGLFFLGFLVGLLSLLLADIIGIQGGNVD